ncbi:Gfo/Idh/MocA family oxidoreductase [Paenibacillus sp. SYP-B3998]|uniref:Gfo/Idh/MocA family oxidoreductase n=1 Tax=Paenibacillus sp. SYP-B3998 TaxID=2678564 RepID=A0A6G4A035_9BACL|nr:Gfo/Idh/MocA family oxidoreductase [Paenibacillus sp. SYP-B3998]NEW07823.1 Gfo/Idh/MocA family oxidoreductase [Paenibacillus sp. SYP-B3998]
MIRVAMLSFWHVHARDYAQQAVEHPNTEIVAVWDELPDRGQAEATARGVAFYEDLKELLVNPEIDGVIIDTPTNHHREVIIKAARAGKHIFTEKVIAPTLQEANDILKAVAEAGVKLTVSLPRLNAGSTQAIQAVLEQELLGQITLVRTRLSHNGGLPTASNPNGWLPEHFYNEEQCGGGALIDLGCHPMYLTRLLLGMPESVSASYGYVAGRDVEDNAVATLHYANGAIGIVEAGFVNAFSPFVIEVHGTDGSLLYSEQDGKLWLRTSRLAEANEQWMEQKNWPAAKPSAFHQWVAHIQAGTEAVDNIQLATDLTKLMEASNRSAATKQQVRIDALLP